MNKFSYTKNKSKFFLFSAICVILGILCIVVRGVNWDVDFAGGTEMNIRIKTDDKNVAKEVENITKKIVGGDFSSVTSVSDTTGDSLLIKTNEISSEKRDLVMKTIEEKYGKDKVIVTILADRADAAYITVLASIAALGAFAAGECMLLTISGI